MPASFLSNPFIPLGLTAAMAWFWLNSDPNPQSKANNNPLKKSEDATDNDFLEKILEKKHKFEKTDKATETGKDAVRTGPLDVFRDILVPALDLFQPGSSEKFCLHIALLDRNACKCRLPSARSADVAEMLTAKRKLQKTLEALKESMQTERGGAGMLEVFEEIDSCSTAVENTCYNAGQDFACILAQRY